MKDSVVGGWLAMLGGIGVALITAIYASAPPIASAPLPTGADLIAAVSASRDAMGRLWLAGNIGLVADLLLIGGGLLLAIRSTTTVPMRLMWLLVSISTLIFVGVDGIAGGVLPRLLAGTEPLPDGYAAVRALYDLCFTFGCALFGAGLLFAVAEPQLPRRLRVSALVGGLLGVGGFGLSVFGLTLPLLLGAAVGLAGVLGAVFGWREIRSVH